MTDLQKCVRHDLLYRLRWNLLADLDDIEISVGPNIENEIVKLFQHTLADEALTTTRLSRILVQSEDCERKYELSYDGSPEPDGYRPPPTKFIDNADGNVITLGKFVTEVHSYLNEHMDDIKGALRGMLIKGTPMDKICFKRAYARRHDNEVLLTVSVEVPMEREGSLEQHWALQLQSSRMVAKQARSTYVGFQNPTF